MHNYLTSKARNSHYANTALGKFSLIKAHIYKVSQHCTTLKDQ